MRPIEELLDRPLQSEARFGPHRAENWEANLFRTTNWGCTELEYLYLLSALVGIFKPSVILETGTLAGDGTIGLMHGAQMGTTIVTVGEAEFVTADLHARLQAAAVECGCKIVPIRANTRQLITLGDRRLADACQGKCTFAFLDTTIPDRPSELAFIGDPANGVMDLSKACCVCIHDMSALRHPAEMHAEYQATAVEQITAWSNAKGWQRIRLHQSRGMIVLAKYPY